MSQSRRRRALGAGVVSVGMVAAVAITTAPAMGAPQYTRIDQSSMTAVAADSVENSGEGVNGPIGLVLDGDDSTYWHTQWKDTVAPTPHWFVIKLADKAVDLARVDLTPRQSSNGSGRVHEYKLFAVNTPQCTKDSFGTASPVTSGQFDGLVANKAQVRSIVLDNPVKATCVKVQYDSSWGGASGSADTSPTEQVASLAEFNAFTSSTSSATPTTPAAPLTPQVPKGTLSI
ncbi:MAG: discoidin domain-containing protein, partial [Cutibacterium avidum]|nr:discoidin domain-containing protein [Cutibacterium avidum]